MQKLFILLLSIIVLLQVALQANAKEVCREVPDDVEEQEPPKKPISRPVYKLPLEDEEDEETDPTEPETEESSLIECPDLTKCKVIKGLTTPNFENKGPSGTVCTYTVDNLNSCSLSRAASFCVLQGITFGDDEIIINADGTTEIPDC